jgi:hypothetical protein
MVSCFGIVARLVGGQAIDDRVEQFLFQRSGDLGAFDQFLSTGFRKPAGFRKKVLEPQYVGARRAEYSACVRRRDRLAGQCFAATRELLGRYRYQTPLARAVGSLMRALAATVQNDVTVSQGKSAGYERYRTDWKRQERLLGGQRDIGNAREAFVTPIDLQTFQFQPCQPCFEISRTGYREIDACIAEPGSVAIRIAERQCTVFCHMPVPSERRTVLATVEAIGLTVGGSIKHLTAFDYAVSELRQAGVTSDEYAILADGLDRVWRRRKIERAPVREPEPMAAEVKSRFSD